MDLEFLNVPSAPPPPPTAAYSHAVRAGEYLFVTGQLGVDPSNQRAGARRRHRPDRPADGQLADVPAGAGTTLARVVTARVYLTDFAGYAAMNAAYASYFAPGCLPARATVGVTGLALDAAVEIDLIVRM